MIFYHNLHLILNPIPVQFSSPSINPLEGNKFSFVKSLANHPKLVFAPCETGKGLQINSDLDSYHKILFRKGAHAGFTKSSF